MEHRKTGYKAVWDEPAREQLHAELTGTGTSRFPSPGSPGTPNRADRAALQSGQESHPAGPQPLRRTLHSDQIRVLGTGCPRGAALAGGCCVGSKLMARDTAPAVQAVRGAQRGCAASACVTRRARHPSVGCGRGSRETLRRRLDHAPCAASRCPQAPEPATCRRKDPGSSAAPRWCAPPRQQLHHPGVGRRRGKCHMVQAPRAPSVGPLPH